MAKRELSKCRVWERERRDRLKNLFSALAKLLPGHETSAALSKAEVLQRAASAITDLQRRNKDLLSGAADTARSEELRLLNERLEKLLARNEQLCSLLRSAGLRIPTEPGIEAIEGPPRKWSAKISPEKARQLAKQHQEKKISPNKTQRTKSVPVRARKKNNRPTRSLNENIDVNNKPQGKKLNKVVTKGLNQVISKRVARLGSPVYTNPSLGPGTLILANGSVLPVVQAPPVGSTTVILVPSQNGPRKISCKSGRGAKVPIPPLRQTVAPKAAPQTLGKKKIKRRPLKKCQKKSEVKEKKLETDKKIVAVDDKLDPSKTIETKDIPSKDIQSSNKTELTKTDENNRIKEITSVSGDGPLAEAVAGPTVEVGEQSVPETSVSKENSNFGISEASFTAAKSDSTRNDKNLEPVQSELSSDLFAELRSAGGGVDPPPTVLLTETKEVISSVTEKVIDVQVGHSELSNDIFAELGAAAAVGGGVSGSHHPESMSPTAAFLLAFPLVSTLTAPTGGHAATAGGGKEPESRQDTPTLLQIGTIENSTAPSSHTYTTTDNFSSWLQQTAPNTSAAPKVYFPQNSAPNKKHSTDYVRKNKHTPERKQEFSSTSGGHYGELQYKTQADNCNTFNPFADVNHGAVATPGGGTKSQYQMSWGYSEYGYQECAKEKLASAPGGQRYTGQPPPLYDQNHAPGYVQEEKEKRKTTVNWMTEHTAFPPPPPPPVPPEWGEEQRFNGQQPGYKPPPPPEEEIRWSWSPGRLLPQFTEPPPPALPTLIGDLALSIAAPGEHQQAQQQPPPQERRPNNRHTQRNRNYGTAAPAEMVGGSFSVSQLVDKRAGSKQAPAAPRANNGTQQSHAKRKNTNTDCFKGAKWDNKRYKQSSGGSYSAEALIGGGGQQYTQQPPPYQQGQQYQGGYTGNNEDVHYTPFTGGGYIPYQPSGTAPVQYQQRPRNCAAPKRGSRKPRPSELTVPPFAEVGFGGGTEEFPHVYPAAAASNTQLTNFNLSAIFPEMGAKMYAAPHKSDKDRQPFVPNFNPQPFNT